MKGFALAFCVLVGLAAVVVSLETPKTEAELDGAHEWMEPEYAEPSLLETSGKLRGIPVTVHPRKGMVTYISPAKKVQPIGFVFQPPPSVQIVHSHPAPKPVAVIRPLIAEHVVDDHHMHYHHGRPHHAPYHLNEVPFWSPDDHFPHGHDHHDMDWLNGNKLNMHRHHRYVHPTSTPEHFYGHRRHGHHHGIHGGHAYHRLPVGVPSALFTQPVHRPHYGHDGAISQGPITVPAGPVAMESPDHTGYNPGFPIQTHSVPTAYYSDGTPHRGSMMQYGGGK